MLKLKTFIKITPAIVIALLLAACSSKQGYVTTTSYQYVHPVITEQGQNGQSTTQSTSLADQQTILYYQQNNYLIPQKYYATLIKLDKLLMVNPNWTINILGNTSNISSSGYNISLGSMRVYEVRKYFLQSGIAASRINAFSYGNQAPIVLGNNPEGNSINNNVILTFNKN